MLPPYVTRDEVMQRLQLVFPDGTSNRKYCVREIAASTVFTMLYIGAVEGSGRYTAPKHIYKMSDEQAALKSDSARVEYGVSIIRQGAIPLGTAWYADNSREPIRDETLRQGLLPLAAAIERPDIATTSSAPRYALAVEFARLFDPELGSMELEQAIQAWQGKYLTPAARARIALVRAGVSGNPNDFVVTFANGETRRLKQGPSAIITKAVVEQFALRFLERPGVLWLSESGNKVVQRDEILAKKIGLHIDPSRNLPDIILVDLSDPPLLVFVEVVATDGAVSEARRSELHRLGAEAGLEERHMAFVTAVLDRDQAALRKAVSILAWDSFVWVASEPEHLIALVKHDIGGPLRLRALLMR